MNWQRFGITVLAVPAALLTMAASTPPAEATPAPTPTSVSDPGCAFTTGCTSPSPQAGVRGASVTTPGTGADAGFLAGLGALPLVAGGLAAIRWSRRRR